jgi:hypothetical protein
MGLRPESPECSKLFPPPAGTVANPSHRPCFGGRNIATDDRLHKTNRGALETKHRSNAPARLAKVAGIDRSGSAINRGGVGTAGPPHPTRQPGGHRPATDPHPARPGQRAAASVDRQLWLPANRGSRQRSGRATGAGHRPHTPVCCSSCERAQFRELGAWTHPHCRHVLSLQRIRLRPKPRRRRTPGPACRAY